MAFAGRNHLTGSDEVAWRFRVAAPPATRSETCATRAHKTGKVSNCWSDPSVLLCLSTVFGEMISSAGGEFVRSIAA